MSHPNVPSAGPGAPEPKLPDVDSPPPEDILDSLPSKEEIVERAQSAQEIIEQQPDPDELLRRKR